MRRITHITAWLLMAMIGSAQSMDCLQRVDLSEEEMECCRQMAGNCGSAMREHSCCAEPVAPNQKAVKNNTQVVDLDFGVNTSQDAGQEQPFFRLVQMAADVSPQESPPKTIDILRI